MTKTFLVADNSLFIPVARALARSGNRVLYHNLGWQQGFPKLEAGIIGDGLPDIECVPDLWDVKDEVDCFVFPDIQAAGLQCELRRQGKRVWGSAKGQTIENDRLFFLEKLKELGLDVPPYTPIKGLKNLRLFLKDKSDIWIKMSKWRGSFETWVGWISNIHPSLNFETVW